MERIKPTCFSIVAIASWSPLAITASKSFRPLAMDDVPTLVTLLVLLIVLARIKLKAPPDVKNRNS